MKRNLWFLFFVFVLAVLSSSLVYCAEVFFPASQLEKGSPVFSLIYGNISEKLNFTVNSRDEIIVGNNSYLSSGSNDLESNGNSNSFCAKIAFNPNNGLYYWLKAGTGSYDLEITSSEGSTNKLTGQDKGFLCGFGARKLLFPDTIVTPAVAIDLGMDYSTYGIDSLGNGNSAPVLISDKLEIVEYQADVVVSKKIKYIEPYGGIKIYRKIATLTNKADIANVSGTRDDAGLFAGVKIEYYQHEALIIEGSLGTDTSISAGLNIGF